MDEDDLYDVLSNIRDLMESNKSYLSIREAGFAIDKDTFSEAYDLFDEAIEESCNILLQNKYTELVNDGTIEALLEEIAEEVCSNCLLESRYYEIVMKALSCEQQNINKLNLNKEEDNMYTPLDIQEVHYWTVNGKKLVEYSDTSLLSIIKDLQTAEKNIKELDITSRRKDEILEEISKQRTMIIKELDTRTKPTKD